MENDQEDYIVDDVLDVENNTSINDKINNVLEEIDQNILDENDIDHEGGHLVLRRVVTHDGRSRAYINDQAVSIGLLRDVGDVLVEVHGQHDERGLLNARGHRDLLDAYGGYGDLIAAVRDCWRQWQDASAELHSAEEKLAIAKADEEYIQYNLDELDSLAPQEGEEASLAESRTLMMQGETLSAGVGEALDELLSNKGAEAALRNVARRLERMGGQVSGRLDTVIEMLDRALVEVGEATTELQEIMRALQFDPQELEGAEERLFALRAAARKHNCSVDGLVALQDEFRAKLDAIEYGDENLRSLKQQVDVAREDYMAATRELSSARQHAAHELDALINAELPPLKLEKAEFRTNIVSLSEQEWGAAGAERVEFLISTNPGAPFSGLIKVASGGELSRFILALKVVLAKKSTAPVLVFDEVDRGVGGAVADAVGERLSRLSKEAQILVITHSPQVAARGNSHWHIHKGAVDEGDDTVVTRVVPLAAAERREEIARMLSGAEITAEARAAADSLIQRSL